MSITTTGNALLPIRRDGQISGGSSTLGGGGSSSMGGGGGVTAHSALSQLDYASAGHTGFAPSDNPTFTTGIITPALKVTTGAALGNMLISDADGDLSYLGAGATTKILVGGGAANPVWTEATGTGAPVRAGDPTFTGTVNTTTIHGTTLLIDHIGEHTGAHSVVFDNAMKGESLESVTAFSSGFAGNGYKVIETGGVSSLEVDQLLVRGSARFRELIIDQLSVVGGSDLLSIARGKIASIDVANSKVTLEDPNGRGTSAFAVGDFFWIKSIDIDNTAFIDCKGQIPTGGITGVTLTLDFTVTGHTGAITDINVGDVIVQRGHPTTAARQNLIYRTVSDTDNPYERTLTGVNSIAAFTNLANVALQTGNLKSLASYGIVPADPKVGIYTTNGYFTGIASFGTNPSVYSALSGISLATTIAGADIYEGTLAANGGYTYINRLSYNGGTSYYRNTVIGDGKNSSLLICSGGTGSSRIVTVADGTNFAVSGSSQFESVVIGSGSTFLAYCDLTADDFILR